MRLSDPGCAVSLHLLTRVGPCWAAGRGCMCPALSPGPICPAGQASPGSCACPTSKTTPFVHKDHVKKLVKRELPESFSGPVVLAQDSPSVKGGSAIKVPLTMPCLPKATCRYGANIRLCPQTPSKTQPDTGAHNGVSHDPSAP